MGSARTHLRPLLHRVASMALPLLIGAACAVSPDGDTAWPVVWSQPFARAETAVRCATTDPACWRWSDAGGRASLELLGDSRYQPAVRSPTSIALLPDAEVADFDLDVDLLQTGRDYGHRDLCVFFGFRSPQQYYYVHLATTPDANAHNVFVVDGAPRRNLLPPQPRGVDWGRDVWHHVRIERRCAAGTVAVYWDRGATPILVAQAPRFAWGRIGFGSFDDSGRFADVVVRAPERRRLTGPADPFAYEHRSKPPPQ